MEVVNSINSYRVQTTLIISELCILVGVKTLILSHLYIHIHKNMLGIVYTDLQSVFKKLISSVIKNLIQYI